MSESKVNPDDLEESPIRIGDQGGPTLALVSGHFIVQKLVIHASFIIELAAKEMVLRSTL